MSVSIIEALKNAEINIENAKRIGRLALLLAQEQLHNAVVLLERGYGIDEKVEPLLKKYGDVANVPDKEGECGGFGLHEIIEWASWVNHTEGTEVSASGNAICVAHAILEALERSGEMWSDITKSYADKQVRYKLTPSDQIAVRGGEEVSDVQG